MIKEYSFKPQVTEYKLNKFDKIKKYSKIIQLDTIFNKIMCQEMYLNFNNFCCF